MREIKCRAWYPFEGRFIKGKDIQNKSIPIRNTRYGFSLKTRFILQQYTGLKDKNGHEIYEGDIVESNWNNAIEEIKDIRSVDWLLSDGFLAGQENDGCLMGAKVIGNIYENPELIKDKQ